MKNISIVIVSWNTGDALDKCLDSINKLNKTNYILSEVIVVDNGSNDNTVELLHSMVEVNQEKSSLSYELKVIYNEANNGFAKACNQGAKVSKSDYILFLNPDMMLFEDTLQKCFDYIYESNVEELGALGIRLVDEYENTLRTCSRLPRKRYYLAKCLGINRVIKKWNAFMIEWNHEDSRRVDEVMGAFFLVDRNIFEKIGRFDERFFVYYEEVDFCKRLKDMGYYVFYYSDATAYHEGGGASNQVKDYRLFYELRSRYLYEQKHYGKKAAGITLFLIYCEYISRYVFLKVGKRANEIACLRNAYRMLYKWNKMKDEQC